MPSPKSKMYPRRVLRIAPVILALLLGAVASSPVRGAAEEGAGRILLALPHHQGADLPRLSRLPLRPRHVGRDVLLADVDEGGLERLRAAGVPYTVIDRLTSGGKYFLVFEPEAELAAFLAEVPGATPADRDGYRILYRDPQPLLVLRFETEDHPLLHHPHLHGMTLPERIELRAWLPDAPPPFIAARRTAGGGALLPALRLTASERATLTENIMSHVNELAYNDTTDTPRSRHAFRTETRDFAAEYIRAAFEDALGGAGTVTTVGGFRCGSPGDTTLAPNVIARVPGSGGGGEILITGHYDAIGNRTVYPGEPGRDWDPLTDPAPGADDNASGVAATIEAARILAPMDFDFDLVFVAWACEEIFPEALWGSRAYADSAAARGDSIWAVLNMDMVGYTAAGATPRIVLLSTPGSEWLADLLRDVGPSPGFAYPVEKYVGTAFYISDQAPFWNVGYDALLLTESLDVRNDNPNYHTIYDLPGTVDADLAAANVELVTNALSTLASRSAPDLALGAGNLRIGFVNPQSGPDVYADPGDTLALTVTLRNLGLGMTSPSPVDMSVRVRDADGRDELVGTNTVNEALLFGEGIDSEFIWPVPAGARGELTFTAGISGFDAGLDVDAENNEASATIVARSAPAMLFEAYVYPNPVRNENDFRLHFQLSDAADVTFSVFTLDGTLLGSESYFYRTAPLATRPRLGPNEQYGWDEIAPGVSFPASGLYFVRIEAREIDNGPDAGSVTLKVAVER